MARRRRPARTRALFAEVAQVLLKKQRAGFLLPNQAKTILDEILSLPLRATGHRELVIPATLLAHERGLTVYDALFLALAQRDEAELLTADAELARASRE